MLAGEVKWGKVSDTDLDKFVGTVAAVPDAERVFECRKKLKHEGVEILTPPDLVRLASEHRKHENEIMAKLNRGNVISRDT